MAWLLLPPQERTWPQLYLPNKLNGLV